ncbi:MAG: hypothetical protein ACE5JU_24605 [Candidatus Binatia bacterium]
MTKTVYFDTNVFDHIHKGIGITKADLLALRSALGAGKISILLSYLNLEEALSALDSCPALAKAELQLILDLADWKRMVKPANMLLSGDINCYARGEVPSQPFISDPAIQSNLRAMLDPSRQDMGELLTIAKESRKQKEEFMAGMRQATKKVLPHAKKLKGQRLTFHEYCERLADKLAESFAERVEVRDACQKRGIKGLLEIRSIRLAVGANLSLTYAQAFEGRTPKFSDSRDICHAVLASAASVFVTQDGAFARLLDRIPIEGFRVVDICELLKEIR